MIYQGHSGKTFRHVPLPGDRTQPLPRSEWRLRAGFPMSQGQASYGSFSFFLLIRLSESADGFSCIAPTKFVRFHQLRAFLERLRLDGVALYHCVMSFKLKIVIEFDGALPLIAIGL